METIGNNFSNALYEVMNQGGYFVPNPDTAMTIETLQHNYSYLNDQIAMFTAELEKLKFHILSGDKKAAKNLSDIITVQSNKLMLYEQAITGKGVTAGEVAVQDPNGEYVDTPLPAYDNPVMDYAKKHPLVIVAGALTLWELLAPKKYRLINK